jgi:hypothetical protein
MLDDNVWITAKFDVLGIAVMFCECATPTLKSLHELATF